MISQRRKQYYRGVPTAPYDLIREGLIAIIVTTILVVLLALILSSPDVRPLTVTSLSSSDPQAFVQTAITELNGTSEAAMYGPPYNNPPAPASQQSIGPFAPQKWFGVHIPINAAQDFVLNPLTQASATNPALKTALTTYTSASSSQQNAWLTAYNTVVGKATAHGSQLTVPACTSCGPLPIMMASYLKLGQSGAVDGLLLTTSQYYQTDFTRPLMFLEDIPGFGDYATSLNLQGEHWGVMNETGNYPGQAWLWLYTLWYQIPPFNTAWASNVDLWAVVMTFLGTVLLMLVPWIPGLRDIPRYVKVYRLIWKDYYRNTELPDSPPQPGAQG
jgi:hypothetical protein